MVYSFSWLFRISTLLQPIQIDIYLSPHNVKLCIFRYGISNHDRLFIKIIRRRHTPWSRNGVDGIPIHTSVLNENGHFTIMFPGHIKGLFFEILRSVVRGTRDRQSRSLTVTVGTVGPMESFLPRLEGLLGVTYTLYSLFIWKMGHTVIRSNNDTVLNQIWLFISPKSGQ